MILFGWRDQERAEKAGRVAGGCRQSWLVLRAGLRTSRLHSIVAQATIEMQCLLCLEGSVSLAHATGLFFDFTGLPRFPRHPPRAQNLAIQADEADGKNVFSTSMCQAAASNVCGRLCTGENKKSYEHVCSKLCADKQ